MKKEIDELLTKSRVAITNGLNQPAIAAMLLEFGYTPERLAEGELYMTQAENLNSQQIVEDAEQKEATVTLNKAIKEANKSYMVLVKVARVAFAKDAKRWVQLELGGIRKETQSGWFGQTKVFYTNLLADAEALTKMATYGQTKEKIEAGYTLVTLAEKALANRKKEMGEAQDATVARDTAMDELQEWYADYIKIARIALANQPQYMEMLGIIQPS